MDNIAITVIGIIIGIILLFLILREVVCWYYKINERIDLQKQQISLLKKILYEKEFVIKQEETNSKPILKEEKEQYINPLKESEFEREKVDLKQGEEVQNQRFNSSYLIDNNDVLDNSVELTNEEGKIIDEYIKNEYPLGTFLIMNKLNREITFVTKEEYKKLTNSDSVVLFEW